MRNMGKFKHLNEQEIISHIEKFGTEDERELLGKLQLEPSCDGCIKAEEVMTILETVSLEVDKAIGKLE